MAHTEFCKNVNWDKNRWPNFSCKELASPDTGEIWWDTRFFDMLQKLRDKIEVPLQINSGHRTKEHNLSVGGAKMSRHVFAMAVDISLHNISDKYELYRQAKKIGFTGFGFGSNFLHVDTRESPAHWFYGPKTKPNQSKKDWPKLVL